MMQGEFGLGNENSGTQEVENKDEGLGVSDFGEMGRILNAEENFGWVERIWDGLGEFGKVNRSGENSKTQSVDLCRFEVVQCPWQHVLLEQSARI